MYTQASGNGGLLPVEDIVCPMEKFIVLNIRSARNSELALTLELQEIGEQEKGK